MDTEKITSLKKIIKSLQNSVKDLKKEFPSKSDGFTLDGRLVGDIGEVVAEQIFQIVLHEGVTKYYDAVATYDNNINIQIKTTFKQSLTYNHDPDYFIGIKLFENGDFKVVYNGPGEYIKPHYGHRKDFGKKLLSFPIIKLSQISADIPDSERIRLRKQIPINDIYFVNTEA